MSIITKGAKLPKSPDMPQGFDDPESSRFIPEHLRPHWAEAQPKVPFGLNLAMKIQMKADELAIDRAVAQVGYELPAVDPGRMLSEKTRRFLADQRGEVAKIAREGSRVILSDEYAEVLALVEHELRTEDAERLHKRAEARTANNARVRKVDTCQVCGEFDPARNGSNRARFLGDSKAFPFKSCLSCYSVATAEFTASRSTDERRTAVRSALEAVL